MDLTRQTRSDRPKRRARALAAGVIAAVVVLGGAATAQASAWRGGSPGPSNGQPTTPTTMESPGEGKGGPRTLGVRW
jgi:hypothetical protein